MEERGGVRVCPRVDSEGWATVGWGVGREVSGQPIPVPPSQPANRFRPKTVTYFFVKASLANTKRHVRNSPPVSSPLPRLV